MRIALKAKTAKTVAERLQAYEYAKQRVLDTMALVASENDLEGDFQVVGLGQEENGDFYLEVTSGETNTE